MKDKKLKTIKTEFEKITDLMEIKSEAHKLAVEILERSDDNILLDQAKRLKTLIIKF